MVRTFAPALVSRPVLALQEIVRKAIVLGSAIALILAGKALPF